MLTALDAWLRASPLVRSAKIAVGPSGNTVCALHENACPTYRGYGPDSASAQNDALQKYYRAHDLARLETDRDDAAFAAGGGRAQ